MSDEPDHALRAASASERDTRVVPQIPRPALVAPAASLESFYAAMDFGADAVRLFLEDFSEDGGLDLDALNLAAGHARNNEREVYVVIDGLIRESQWPGVVRTLCVCDEVGVSAVILRDMGLVRVIRERFPHLRWHASEGLRIHNPHGARWADRNGFRRATLPRELTVEEIREIGARARLGLDVFVHGRLCHVRAHRRNTAASDAATTAIEQLVDAGVQSLTIDAQLHSPLFVAAATDLYRKLIDRLGRDSHKLDGHWRAVEARRASRLYFHPTHGDAPRVNESNEDEAPGLYLGTIEEIRGERAHFEAANDFQRMDSVAAHGRREGGPPVVSFDTNRINREGRRVFEVSRGERVSIAVPPGVKPGDELRLVTSLSIRRRYPTGVPKNVQRARLPVHLEVALKVEPGGRRLTELGMKGLIEITGRVFMTEVSADFPCKLLFADNQPLDEVRLRRFFERLGSTRFELKTFSGIIPAGVFVPAAEVNEARRQFFDLLKDAVSHEAAEKRQAVLEEVTASREATSAPASEPRFSAMVDRPAYIDALPMKVLEEVVLDISAVDLEDIRACWEHHPGKLRLAVPGNLRKWPLAGTREKLSALYRLGVRRFQVASLAGFELVAEAAGVSRKRKVDTAEIMSRAREVKPRDGAAAFEPNLPDFQRGGLDIVTDCGCCSMNRQAVRFWLEQGASQIAFHIADNRENLAGLLAEFADSGVVVVYQDTPKFAAETCVNADRLGHCPGLDDCDFTETEVKVDGDEHLRVVNHQCRSLVYGTAPFSWSNHISELGRMGARRFRLDFIYRRYESDEIRRVCEQVMSERELELAHAGNWE